MNFLFIKYNKIIKENNYKNKNLIVIKIIIITNISRSFSHIYDRMLILL